MYLFSFLSNVLRNVTESNVSIGILKWVINSSCLYCCFTVIFQSISKCVVTILFVLFHVPIYTLCLFVSCHFAFEKDLAKIESSGPLPIDIQPREIIEVPFRSILSRASIYPRGTDYKGDLHP